MGSFDLTILVLNVINALIAKGFLTVHEAKKIIKNSLPPTMSEKEKDDFTNSIFGK